MVVTMSFDTNLRTMMGVTPAQVALAWVLSKPGVTSPIVGASRLSQLDEAVAALQATD